LVWAGVRLGPQGTALAILNVSVMATLATAHGLGPFVHHSLNTSLLLTQAFIGNITMTTLVLAAVIQERTRAENALAESRDELEQRVKARTTELAGTNLRLHAEIERGRANGRALRESEERYRILVEVNPEAVFVTSIDETTKDQRIVYANPAAIVLLGAKAAELIGMHPSKFVPAQRREALQARVLEVLALGRAGPFEDSILRPDGDVIPVEATGALVPWDNGTAILIVLRDITRRKKDEMERAQLYHEAEESIRARDEFLSIASHELKTPLTSLTLQLQGMARKAQKDSSLGPNLGPTVDVALRQTSRLNTLVDDLLDVSRITQGRLVFSFEDVDLTETVRDVATRLQQVAMRAGCSIRLQEYGAVMGHWDRTRLEQVIENLLSNAVKYGARQPIDVEVLARADNEATLSVRDRGIGISTEDHARIFGQFERAVSVNQFGGFGLGLWIARQIVEAHGGRIAVESAPGQGSTFTVTLPRTAARCGSGGERGT
jgi:PAS domain S-box-containing protein